LKFYLHIEITLSTNNSIRNNDQLCYMNNYMDVITYKFNKSQQNKKQKIKRFREKKCPREGNEEVGAVVVSNAALSFWFYKHLKLKIKLS